MKKGSLITSTSYNDRCLDGRVDIKFYLRLTEVDWYRGTTGQWKIQLTGFVKHPLRFVPTNREVLVVKNRHGAFALLKNFNNLLIDPPARQHPLPFEVGWIFPVFSYNDNAINRKFLTSKRNGLANCFEDGNVFRLANFLT